MRKPRKSLGLKKIKEGARRATKKRMPKIGKKSK
jgi:hypothetical protein